MISLSSARVARLVPRKSNPQLPRHRRGHGQESEEAGVDRGLDVICHTESCRASVTGASGRRSRRAAAEVMQCAMTDPEQSDIDSARSLHTETVRRESPRYR